jgi:hypothetical protein
MLGAQPADFFFQCGQPLQHVQYHLLDTGRHTLPVLRSNFRIGISQQCSFHWPETTKSKVIFHGIFSVPADGYQQVYPTILEFQEQSRFDLAIPG